MKIGIHNQTNHDETALKQILFTVFNNIEEAKEMQVILVSKEEIKRLNSFYRGIDKVTDVLSFFDDTEESLGDVFICVDQAIVQADEHGHSFAREIAFLAVHGYLHLIGYDHITDRDERKMITRQEEILTAAHLERGVKMKEELINAAKKAMSRAYAPYSNFKVGAAVLLKDGTIVQGANIENSAYGLSNCAERSALFSLMSSGFNKNDIIAMAIIGATKEVISPCGACRQVMAELLPTDAIIYLCNLDGKVAATKMAELLPFSFDLFEDAK